MTAPSACTGDTAHCIVDGCERPVRCKQVCERHYQKLRKYGDASAGRDRLHGLSNEERYWARVDIGGEDECWPWQGARHPDGYGTFRLKRSDGSFTTVRAHRWAYERFVGPLTASLEVCHRCDNPPCQNPRHWFAGTHLQNVRDCAAKDRIVGGMRRKLTPAQVLEIRARPPGSYGWKSALAREFSVSPAQISKILLGHSWVT